MALVRRTANVTPFSILATNVAGISPPCDDDSFFANDLSFSEPRQPAAAAASAAIAPADPAATGAASARAARNARPTAPLRPRPPRRHRPSGIAAPPMRHCIFKSTTRSARAPIPIPDTRRTSTPPRPATSPPVAARPPTCATTSKRVIARRRDAAAPRPVPLLLFI